MLLRSVLSRSCKSVGPIRRWNSSEANHLHPLSSSTGSSIQSSDLGNNNNNNNNDDHNRIAPRPNPELVSQSLHNDHLDALSSPLEGFKLQPQKYIILGARSSKLLPRFRRPKVEDIKELKVDMLDEQRKQLMVFKSEASPQVILDSIALMKPLNDTVSVKRYDQISYDLIRAYTVAQLREFCIKNIVFIPNGSMAFIKRSPKKTLTEMILKQIWGLKISDQINESTDVIIEKTIQLTRRELFLIVSRNGQIPRSWTKSGARVVILGEEQKIIIRSTANTYDWILASLHKTLQTVHNSAIGLDPYQIPNLTSTLPLRRIQLLSNTYLEPHNDNKLMASALSYKDLDHARRLITHSTKVRPCTSDTYIFDESNLTKNTLSKVIDDEALDWNERSKNWYRWQKIKTKESNGIDNMECRKLSIMADENNDIKESGEAATNDSVADIVVSTLLNEKIKSYIPDSSRPLTFSASFGYVLHETSDPSSPFRDIWKNSNKAFTTNIPLVSEKCASLPFNNLDIEHEEEKRGFEDSSNKENINNNERDGDYLWKRLLLQSKQKAELQHADDMSPKRFKLSKSDSETEVDEFTYFVQLKFVPSPAKENFKQLPPVEMWLEIDSASDQVLEDSCKLVAADKEDNAFLSLPDQPADVKFTAAHVRYLDHDQPSIQSFLNKSTLDFSGSSTINVPDSIMLKIGDDQEVEYIYQAMYHRRQTDHKYKSHILQFATIEGGGFGGRRVEANIILDYSDGVTEFDEQELKKLVVDSLTFMGSLAAQPRISVV